MLELPNTTTPETVSNSFEPQPRELDLDDSVKYTFVLVGGAFNSSNWYRLGNILAKMDHNVIYPELPTEDPSANFEDDTKAVLQAIHGKSNIVYMTHSRGVETNRIFRTEDLGRFVCVEVISSAGPHFFELPADASDYENDSRYNPLYKAAIITRPDGLTEITTEDARRFLYSDVENEDLVAEFTRNLRPQRSADDDKSGAFTLPTDDISIKVRVGSRDQVLNINQAKSTFWHWAGLEVDTTSLQTDHSPQASATLQLARLSIDHANQARKNPLN